MKTTEKKIGWIKSMLTIVAKVLPRAGQPVNKKSRELTKTESALFQARMEQHLAEKPSKTHGSDRTPDPKTKHGN